MDRLRSRYPDAARIAIVTPYCREPRDVLARCLAKRAGRSLFDR